MNVQYEEVPETWRQVDKVSIIIPTRGDVGVGESKPLWLNCIESIIQYTAYENFEIVLITDNEIPLELLDNLTKKSSGFLKIINWELPFNFSKKMNWGYTFSDGEYILLMNDDIEVIEPSWLDEMLLLMKKTNAGMVGATLLFPDGTLQHAGQTIYKGGPTHIARGLRREDPYVAQFVDSDREVLGVTAACALISSQLYLQCGGFSTLFPGNYNDVDLCLKVRSQSLPIFISSKAILVHHESVTRNSHVHFHELDLLESRWGINSYVDPFWEGHPYVLTSKSGKYISGTTTWASTHDDE